MSYPRPRFLIISAAFPPLQLAEADHTLRLCERLSAVAEVTLLTTGGGQKCEVSFTVLRSVRAWGWSSLWTILTTARRIRPTGILLVYLPLIYGNHPAITLAPRLMRRWLPKSRIVTLFEIAAPASAPTRIGRAVYKAVCRCLGRDVDPDFGTLLYDSHHVITLSPTHLDALAKRSTSVAGRATVIAPPPLITMAAGSIAECVRRGRSMLGAPDGAFVAVYFGRIYPSKGIPTLLDAWDSFAARVPGKKRLVLVGGTGQLEKVATDSIAELIRTRAAASAPDAKIEWSGEFASGSELPSLALYAADLCVLPFDNGVALNNSSFTTAAAHGKAILTTAVHVAEPPILHGANAYLVKPCDPPAFAEALALLHSDAAFRSRLGEGAARLASAHFNWDAAVRTVCSCLTTPSA